MTHLFRFALLASLAAAPALAQAPAVPRLPSIDLPAELDRVLRDYEKFWRAGQVDSLARIFTDDGFASRPGGWVRGSDAIKDAYSRMAGGDLKLRALAYAVSDTVGYIVGAYAYGATADTRDNGKFILTLRRARGGPWKIASDLDSAIRQQ
jgi:ketosteroid isomerase-like protein